MKVSGSSVKLTVGNIDSVEKKLKNNLPEDYKAFLLEHNGGHPEDCVFSYKMADKKYESLINRFNAIHSEKEYNLLAKFQYYQDQKRIPTNMLPIADDPFGNIICMSLSRDDYGSIYFWDHELEVERPQFENIFFISYSFKDFIDNLKPE